MRKKAFTLIELLVVIAIIAILAAILFPVFAQAKLAAKKTQAVSNVKQLELAIQMYLGDYDDLYVPGFRPPASGPNAGNWGEYSSKGQDLNILWDINIQPYVKNIGIFESPVDSLAGKELGGLTWAGVGISFSTNGWLTGWNNGFVLHGPMGIDGWSGWLTGGDGANGSLNSSALTQPASTIVLAEKDSDDLAAYEKANNSCCGGAGVFSAYGPWSTFTDQEKSAGWGNDSIPDGSPTIPPYDNSTAHAGGVGFGNSQNGAVSVKYGTVSTFAFCDGHAKAMPPVATNPNQITSPNLNMWDGLR